MFKMPTFKPKFSVPSSQLSSAATKTGHEDGTYAETDVALDIGSKETEISEEEIASNEDNLKEQNCASTATAKESNPNQNEIESRMSSLTDEQYDAIFDAVLEKAEAGALSQPQTSLFKPVEAANEFAVRSQNISPTNIKNTNEITPNTSPQEGSSSPAKLLLKKPVKKRPPKSEKQVDLHKRKTLDYIPAHTKTSKSTEHEKRSKEKKVKRRKSDSEVVMHRRKVLNKGVWVQCGEEMCLKWRYLEHCSDPSILPDRWTCSMNKEDATQNKCSYPEVDWTSCVNDTGDHFVYTDYNAGSIVWARMAGYPSWPAMVDSDPDTNLFYDYDSTGRVLRYHVVFLDDRVSRAWIPSRSIEPYNQRNYKAFASYKSREFKSELQSAISTADEAMELSLEQRLEKYNFEKRYIAAGRHKDWAPKRSVVRVKERIATIQRNKSNEKNQEVPSNDASQETESHPTNDDDNQEKSQSPCSAEEETNVKKKDETSKVNHKKSKRSGDSEKKTKTRHESVPTKLDDVKTRFKPTFKAPKVKKSPAQGDSSSPVAVVPQVPPIEEGCSSDAPQEDAEVKRITFDPDIYTMELSQANNEEAKQIEDEGLVEDEEANDVKMPYLENVDDKHEDVDLEYNDGNPGVGYDGGRNDDLVDKDIFGKSFWDAPEVKKVDVDDPFVDMVIDELKEQNWDDERMKELDELMPVISDQF